MGTAGKTEEEQLGAMEDKSVKGLLDALWCEQTTNWPLMKKGYGDLQQLLTKDISVNNITFKAQHNPARIVSSTAKTDRESIAARPCFLCRHNLPAEQKGLLLLGRYIVLTNPFPIVDRHFVIPSIDHIPQRLMGVKRRTGRKGNKTEGRTVLKKPFTTALKIWPSGRTFFGLAGCLLQWGYLWCLGSRSLPLSSEATGCAAANGAAR